MPSPTASRRPSRMLRGAGGLPAAGACGMLAVSVLAGCGGSNSATSPQSRVSGAAGGASDSRTVAIEITSDGCKPPAGSYQAGPLTFQVSNKDATGVTEIELLSGERILGEKENLAPGFSGSFALQLNAGDYTVYCPGAKTERAPLKVTGGTATKAVTDTSQLLKQGTADYARYVNTQIDLMITNTQPLVDAIKNGDLAAAQKAYGNARPYYERIEPIAESFTSGEDNLDADIDARADDVPAATWSGYHRIEKGLFQDTSLAGLEPYATGLMANIRKLQALTKDLTYQPAELANGAVGLLDEAAKTKITGEEERYSHVDLVDLQGNVEGSEQAFAALKPGLDTIDPTLSSTISARFAAIDRILSQHRDASQPGGFVSYSTLDQADTKEIAQALQAISEPLSKVAGKVVNA